MRLGELLKGVSTLEVTGDAQLEISGVSYDSRSVRPGDLFVALRGLQRDGHEFIPEAIQKGAAAVVVESGQHSGEVPPRVSRIRVHGSRQALSKLAANFYDDPSQRMNVIGITGTNGKTTTSFLLESILLQAGVRPGVIGTVNYRFPGHRCPAPVTTPESLDLMRSLRKMADGGVTDVVMEVSSHALDQGRVDDCRFRVAVFTNLSRDHLDYHQSMDAYFRAKSCLFRALGRANPDSPARAVINMDDPRGVELAAVVRVPVLGFGLGHACQVRADEVHASHRGLRATVVTPAGAMEVRSPLIGRFNLYNVLAAAGAAISLGMDLETIRKGIESLEKIPGRLEMVPNERGLAIVVDYAHTPDALQKVLEALRPLAEGRLITVFGCGGDRDRGKRIEMGRVAGARSDVVLITSDNPRTEDPLGIISQIEPGVKETGMRPLTTSRPTDETVSGYSREPDRRLAIQKAVQMARATDWVLIAGKGHEDYQIIGTTRRPFDDREVAAQAASGEL
jgi:UDP-N-acetylmuramoyl-L-alanyl-D-glutamate--2,6-diaminopimelate ligase